MDEPKAGEWWWIMYPRVKKPIPAECLGDEGWGCREGWAVRGVVRPLERIPEPTAPEPTEAEKVDAIVAAALANHKTAHPPRATYIRECIEAAGYVLAPTSGPGFEAMVQAAKAACPTIMTDRFARALRAALAICKGRG